MIIQIDRGEGCFLHCGEGFQAAARALEGARVQEAARVQAEARAPAAAEDGGDNEAMCNINRR